MIPTFDMPTVFYTVLRIKGLSLTLAHRFHTPALLVRKQGRLRRWHPSLSGGAFGLVGGRGFNAPTLRLLDCIQHYLHTHVNRVYQWLILSRYISFFLHGDTYGGCRIGPGGGEATASPSHEPQVAGRLKDVITRLVEAGGGHGIHDPDAATH